MKKIIDIFLPLKMRERLKTADKAMHDKKKNYVSDKSLIELTSNQMTFIHMYKPSIAFAVIMQLTLMLAGVFKNVWQVALFAPIMALLIAMVSLRLFWYFSNQSYK